MLLLLPDITRTVPLATLKDLSTLLPVYSYWFSNLLF